MKTTTTLILAFCLLSLNSFSQTSNSFETSFESQDERTAWEMYKLGEEDSPFNIWEFETVNGHTGDYAMVHYYPVGGSETTDDWIVSTELNLEGGGMIDSIWTYYSGFGMPFGIDTVGLYLITGDRDPSLATNQQLLYLFTDSTYQNDNTWRKFSEIEIPAISGTSYLAFRYKTVINWLDIRIDDLGFTINWPQNVDEISEDIALNIFPNPANGVVFIEVGGDEPTQLEIIDLTGKIVWSEKVTGSVSINNLAKGLYVVKAQNTKGSSAKKLIIQ